MPLDNKVKEHRARLGINQTDFGKLCGVSRQTSVEEIFSYEEDPENESEE